MEMKITFPGGKRVDAEVGGHIIRTDQSPAAGGAGSAPEPFVHFLASIGTCAGIYVLGYCQARGIPTDGIQLVQRVEFDAATHKLSKVAIDVQVPPSFPEKHLQGVMHAASHCAVKKAILSPPEFEVRTQVRSSGAQMAS